MDQRQILSNGHALVAIGMPQRVKGLLNDPFKAGQLVPTLGYSRGQHGAVVGFRLAGVERITVSGTKMLQFLP